MLSLPIVIVGVERKLVLALADKIRSLLHVPE
jgi:hypothetical protein